MKIRTKLMISFALILIIPAIAIGWTSYQTARNEIHEQLIYSAEQSVKFLDSQITDMISKKIVDIDYLASALDESMVDGFESPEVRRVLDQFIATHPDYENVYFGTEEGLMLRSPELDQQDLSYDPRERPWYKSAMNQPGQVVINDPIIATTSGNVTVIPSKRTDDRSGVVGGNINMASLNELNNTIRIGAEGYTFIVDQNRFYLAHPTTPVGETNTQSYIDYLYEHDSGRFTYQYQGSTAKEGVFVTNKLTGWKIIGAIELVEISRATSGILYTTIIVIALSILIGALVTFYIVRSISGSLQIVTEATERIASGDLTEEIPIQTKDELGQLANSMNVMVRKLRDLIGEVLHAAHNVASSSQEISASAEQIATGSSEQASSAQAVNELFTDLTKAIESVAKNAEEAANLSRKTVEIAEEGGNVVKASIDGMNQVNEQMALLEEDSNRIGDIIEVIDDIAEQTNLLALNAAIEAARAGEQGRGFAVVADEVRKLAERSREATEQIARIIKGMQHNTGLSVESVSQAVEKTSQINEAFQRIAEMINESSGRAEEIAAASEEQSAQSHQVLESVETISAASEEAAAASEEMAATTESLAKLAEELNNKVAVFKIDEKSEEKNQS